MATTATAPTTTANPTPRQPEEQAATRQQGGTPGQAERQPKLAPPPEEKFSVTHHTAHVGGPVRSGDQRGAIKAAPKTKARMFDATSAAVKPRLIAVASSPKSPKTCAVVFPAVMGLPLRDCPMGRRAPPDFARYAPTIPGSSKQATIRRSRSRRWRRQCSRECRLCRGHASSELHWLRHRRRDPG